MVAVCDTDDGRRCVSISDDPALAAPGLRGGARRAPGCGSGPGRSRRSDALTGRTAARPVPRGASDRLRRPGCSRTARPDHSCPHRRHCRLVPWLPLPVPRTISFGTSADRHAGHDGSLCTAVHRTPSTPYDRPSCPSETADSVRTLERRAVARQRDAPPPVGDARGVCGRDAPYSGAMTAPPTPSDRPAPACGRPPWRPCPGPAAQDVAAELDELGYGSLWLARGLRTGGLHRRPRPCWPPPAGMVVGTGIANIYGRGAMAANGAARLVESLAPGRFVLGLGREPPAVRRAGPQGDLPPADRRP